MARNSLVAAGEAFLLSPTVAPHSDDSKRKFLLRKGLTKDEITAVFAKSRSFKPTENEPTHCKIMDRCMMEEGHLKNKSEPTRPAAPLLMIAGTATVAMGTVYYLYKIFRKYVWPWIERNWRSFWDNYGRPPPKFAPPLSPEVPPDSAVEDLRYTVDKIQQILDHQQHQISEISSKDHRTVADLRRELDSVRRMLLSKEIFPSSDIAVGLPSTAAGDEGKSLTVKPSWQIRKTPQSISPPMTHSDVQEDEGSGEKEGSYDVLTPPSTVLPDMIQNEATQGTTPEEGSTSCSSSDCSGDLVNLSSSERKLLYSQCLDE